MLRRFALTDGEQRIVQAILDPIEEGISAFSIVAQDVPAEDPSSPSAPDAGDPAEPEWTRYVIGKLSATPSRPAPATTSLSSLRARCTRRIEVADFYAELRRRELDLGPACQFLDEILAGEGEALCRIHSIPAGASNEEVSDEGGAALPFGVIDACFQAAMVPGLDGPVERMIVSVESFRLYAPPTGELYCLANLHRTGDDDDSAIGSFRLLDGQGVALIEADGVLFRPIRRDQRATAAGAPAARAAHGPSPSRPRARLPSFAEALAQHTSPEERAAAALRFLGHVLSDVSGVPADQIRDDERLQKLGLDSFMAIELVALLEKATGTRLSLSNVLQNGTPATLAAELLARAQAPIPAIPPIHDAPEMEEGSL